MLQLEIDKEHITISMPMQNSIVHSMQKMLPLLLRSIGFIILFIGIISAYYGPYEHAIFYLFSEGGPFHYDGFGFGSLWFAVNIIQIACYYIVAALSLQRHLDT